jgi:hypothetical protein
MSVNSFIGNPQATARFSFFRGLILALASANEPTSNSPARKAD